MSGRFCKMLWGSKFEELLKIVSGTNEVQKELKKATLKKMRTLIFLAYKNKKEIKIISQSPEEQMMYRKKMEELYSSIKQTQTAHPSIYVHILCFHILDLVMFLESELDIELTSVSLEGQEHLNHVANISTAKMSFKQGERLVRKDNKFYKYKVTNVYEFSINRHLVQFLTLMLMEKKIPNLKSIEEQGKQLKHIRLAQILVPCSEEENKRFLKSSNDRKNRKKKTDKPKSWKNVDEFSFGQTY